MKMKLKLIFTSELLSQLETLTVKCTVMTAMMMATADKNGHFYIYLQEPWSSVNNLAEKKKQQQ